MLPLYYRTARFVARPYRRMKHRNVLGVMVLLLLLFVLLATTSSPRTETDTTHQLPSVTSAHDPNPIIHDQLKNPMEVMDVNGKETQQEEQEELVHPPQVLLRSPEQAATPATLDKMDTLDTDNEPLLAHKASQAPLLVRLLLPLLAGFCFGFLGSVPIAGPTSAVVLKLGIQGKYQQALTIAFGGAISEAVRAIAIEMDR